MSDFNIEQMKTLLMSLGDRLNHTKGDEEMVARMANIEKLLRVTASKLDKMAGQPQLDPKKLGEEIGSAFGDVMRNHRTVEGQDRRRDQDREPRTGSGGRNMLRMAFERDGEDGKARARKSDATIGKFVDQTVNMIDNLRKLDGSVAGLAKTVGLSGAAFMAVAKYADENIDAYQKLQNSAEGSIASLSEMHGAMQRASMTAAELADAMTKGSDGARLLGATKFADFNFKIKEATRNMGFYGMGFKDILNAQNSYLEMSKNQGTLFQVDVGDMNKRLDQLVLINDKMAGILGKNRDDLLKANEEQSRDANFNEYMQGIGMSADAITNVNQLTAGLAKIEPMLADSFKDFFMNKPKMGTGSFVGNMNQDQQNAFFDLLGKSRSGNIGEDTFKDFAKQLRAAVENAPKDGGVKGLIATEGNETFQALNRMNTASRNLNLNKVEVEKRTGGAESGGDAGTNAMLKIPDAIRTMSATVDAGINKMFDVTMGKIAPVFDNATQSVVEFAKRLGDGIVKTDGMGTSMLTLAGIVGGLAVLGPAIKGVALGLFKLPLLVGKFGRGIFELIKGISGMISGAGSMIKNGLAGVFAAKAAGDATKSATTALSGTADAIKASESAAGAAKGAADAAKGAGTAGSAAAGAAQQAGKAGEAVVDGAKAAENSAKALENAAKNATSVADDAAKAASSAAKAGVVGAEAGAGAQGVMKGVGSISVAGGAMDAGAALAKKLGPIGYALQALSTWNEVEDLFKRYEDGDLKGKDDEFRKQVSKALAKGLGSVAGGIAGAKVGGMIGGGLGAAAGMVAPPAAPVTTAVGAVGGAVGGAVYGAFKGEEMAAKISDYVFENLKDAGKPPEVQATNNVAAPANAADGKPAEAAPRPAEVPASSRTEVPLTSRDMAQPIQAMQTALVEQLMQSNTTLDKILVVLKQMQGLEQEANGINREGYAETFRQLEEMARALKTRSIY